MKKSWLLAVKTVFADVYLAENFAFGEMNFRPKPDSLEFHYSAGQQYHQFAPGYLDGIGLYSNMGGTFAAQTDLQDSLATDKFVL